MFFSLVCSPCCVPLSTCHFLSSPRHLHCYFPFSLFLGSVLSSLSSHLFLRHIFYDLSSPLFFIPCYFRPSLTVFPLFLLCSVPFYLLLPYSDFSFLLSPFNFRFFLSLVPLKSFSSLNLHCLAPLLFFLPRSLHFSSLFLVPTLLPLLALFCFLFPLLLCSANFYAF